MLLYFYWKQVAIVYSKHLFIALPMMCSNIEFCDTRISEVSNDFKISSSVHSITSKLKDRISLNIFFIYGVAFFKFSIHVRHINFLSDPK